MSGQPSVLERMYGMSEAVSSAGDIFIGEKEALHRKKYGIASGIAQTATKNTPEGKQKYGQAAHPSNVNPLAAAHSHIAAYHAHVEAQILSGDSPEGGHLHQMAHHKVHALRYLAIHHKLD